MNTNTVTRPRFYFLDILRSLALIEMMHGHTLDALLSVPLRNTQFYYGLQFFRGITAPLFLYIAGFCFGLATFGQAPVMSHITAQVWQRLKRIFTIVIAGYLLYLPYFSLIKTIQHINTPVWQAFLKTDILRCIGIILLIMQLITFCRLNKPLFYILFVSFTFCLPFLPRLVQNSLLVSRLPDYLRFYLTGSSFPLIYYGAYATFGLVCSRFFNDYRSHWQLLTGLTSIVILLIAIVLKSVSSCHAFINYAIISSFVILLVLIAANLESWWRKLPQILKYFSRESLFIYIAHILIIYGSGYNRGMRFYIGPSLLYFECYLVFIILFSVMMLSAYGLHSLRVQKARLFSWLRYSFYIIFFIILVLRQY